MRESLRQRSVGEFGRHIVAAVVLVIAGFILLKFVLHLVWFLATVIVIGLAIAAIVWALNVLL